MRSIYLSLVALLLAAAPLACAKKGESQDKNKQAAAKAPLKKAGSPTDKAVEKPTSAADVKLAEPARTEGKAEPDANEAEGQDAPADKTDKEVAPVDEVKDAPPTDDTVVATEVVAAPVPKPIPADAKADIDQIVHLPFAEVNKRLKRYVPVPMEWDKTLLTEEEIKLVKVLVRAARVMDHLFWLQASPDGLDWRRMLASRKDPEFRMLFHYLMINYGAYDRLNANEPFLGDQQKPAGAGYYPTDMAKEEFEKWLHDHPDDEKAFKSNFTVIRRTKEGLAAIPYSDEWGRELKAGNKLLLDAADITSNKSLKKYLKTRAAAFLTDDYFESDMAWMDLDSRIEVTIGPYEVYEDHLFGYKAAFEAFITIKDPKETERLKTFADWLVKLEKNLPIPDEHKNFKRGKSSPLPVVDVIFTAGDTRAGVQTIAYNLPNDERVREQKGSKKVILRNVGKAKFRHILRPIALRVLAETLYPLLHEDAYFNHTLLHEISHGLGPGTITVDGKETTVNLAMKELYPALEEAKADILGLYNALFLIDQGVVKLLSLEQGKPTVGSFMAPEDAKRATVATFLAGIFRSTRFGVKEAHGQANLVIFNYLTDKGGFGVDDSGKMAYNFEKTVTAVKDCAAELLMIQALGDYEAGKAFLQKYGTVGEPMKKAWASLESVPVDIEPIYDLP